MKSTSTNKRNFWTMLAGYFGYVMVLLYLVVGLGFLFTNAFSEFIATGVLRITLGILLILYSLFRGFRVYKQIKDEKATK